MTNWMQYVSASYDLIMEAQSRANTILDYDVGAFVVHTFAKHMDCPISDEPVAMKLLTALNTAGSNRKELLTEICENCVLIDGLMLNRNRWVSSDYYKNMGMIAAEQRAYSSRPVEELYVRISQQFIDITNVLRCVVKR